MDQQVVWTQECGCGYENDTTSDGTVCKVVSISKCAFKNNRRLKKIVIGSNVATIGTKAFSGCKKLKKLDIKPRKLNAKGLESVIKGIS